MRIQESLDEFISNKAEIDESVILNKDNETIRQHRAKQYLGRMKALEDIKAPEVLITQMEKSAKDVFTWKNKDVKGIEEFGDEIYAGVEYKKGNGGSPYTQYTLKDGRIVNFFPTAKYGPFFSEYTK